MRPEIVVACMALGCTGVRSGDSETQDSDTSSGEPIVLYWTIDTLGMRAANEAGWCTFLEETFADYGRDVACLEGAVPASTWTEESHVRTLWPQNQVGSLQARQYPDMGQATFLDTIAQSKGVDYLFASDNATFVRDVPEVDETWVQGADEFWVYPEFKGSILAAEEDTAVFAGLEGLLERTADGSGATLYLNDFESGGHAPRCVADPYTPACSVIWDLAVDNGVVDPSEDRLGVPT